MPARELAKRLLEMHAIWRKEHALRIAAERIALEFQGKKPPRRQTEQALRQITPVPAASSRLGSAGALISESARIWLRDEIKLQVDVIDHDRGNLLVRGWLSKLDASIVVSDDLAECMLREIGPRWHHCAAACRSGSCDDPRIWRYLLLLFAAGDAVIVDALWLAWEASHTDSRDVILISSWSP